MSSRNKRFTVYDAMEAAGVFDSNPANSYARDPVTGESLYEGPSPFPQMFYHPKGETRIIVPGEIIVTPLGPKVVGEQHELITQIARSRVEAEALKSAGWHDHPAKAIAASGKAAPAMSPDQRIKDLEAQIRELQNLQQGAMAAKQAEMQTAQTSASQAMKHAIKTVAKAAE